MKKIPYITSLFLSLSFFAFGQNCTYDCVWPGDVNRDGIANYIDIMYIYLAAGEQGAARSDTNTEWMPKNALDWGYEFPISAINGKYGDCDGNGTIEYDDDFIVLHNLYQTNEQFVEPTETTLEGSDLRFRFSQDTLQAGETLTVEVLIGTPEKPIQDLAGLTFKINIDTSLLQENTLQLPFKTEDWFSNFEAVNVIKYDLQNPVYPKDEIGFAFSRTDGTTVNGFGKIFEFSIIMEDNIAGLSTDDQVPAVFEFEQAVGLNRHGVNLQLGAEKNTLVVAGLQANSSRSPYTDTPMICMDKYATDITNDYYDLNSQTWKEQSRTSQLLNSVGKTKQEYTEIYNGTTWIAFQKVDYSYDNNSLTSIIYSNWNTNLNDWEFDIREEYTYDNEKVATTTRSIWNSDQWLPYQLEACAYTNGQLISKHTDQWQSAAQIWLPAYLSTSDWDGNRQLNQYKHAWDAFAENWIPLLKDTFVYTQTAFPTLESQGRWLWQIDTQTWRLSWQDDYESNYYYNQSITKTRANWNIQQAQLAPAFQTLTTPNPYGAICLQKFWYSNYWENLFQWQSELVNTQELELSSNLCQYPNPFPSGSTIACPQLEQNSHLYIYDLHGRLLQQHSLKESNAALSLHLDQGVYIAILQQQEQIIAREKIVVP